METFIASKIELCIYNVKPFQKCKEITTTEHYSCNIDKRVFVDLHMDIFVATLTKKTSGIYTPMVWIEACAKQQNRK